MNPTNSLTLEVFGIKAGAEGQFAIIALLLTFLAAAAGYAAGKRWGWW